MKFLKWIALLFISCLLGWSVVRYLVYPPSHIIPHLILCLLSLLSLFLVIWKGIKKKRFIPIPTSLVLFVVVYLVATYSFLNQEIDHPLPELIRPQDDPGIGHTAVIYFTHGEPESDSPNAWIETMHHLDEDSVPFIPNPFRPFFFNGFRSEYIEAGKSLHNQTHSDLMASLAGLMIKEDNPSLQFYPSFLDTDPRPDAMVIQALNEGASRIVLMPIFLTISSHTAEGIELVEEVNLDSFDVPLCIADPMWESTSLQQMILTRVERELGDTPRDQVGIMLVGHGQPEKWDETYPTQTEQENIFRQEVKELLIDNGFSSDLIALSWMEFEEPDTVAGAKELASKGIEKLVVFPASISADSIHTSIEIPAAIMEADLPVEIEVLCLGSWNSDPLVIEDIPKRFRKV